METRAKIKPHGDISTKVSTFKEQFPVFFMALYGP